MLPADIGKEEIDVSENIDTGGLDSSNDLRKLVCEQQEVVNLTCGTTSSHVTIPTVVNPVEIA